MGRTLRYLFAMSCGAVPALGLFLCLRPLRARRLRKISLASAPSREFVLALFWMYSGGIAVLALTPRWVVPSLAGLLQGQPWNPRGLPFFSPGTVSLALFKTFSYSSYILAANVVLFMPFGLLAALLWRSFRWWKALALGFDIALFIELCQLFIGRACDIDDLLLNTFGVLCGYWLALVFRRVFPNRAANLQVKAVS